MKSYNNAHNTTATTVYLTSGKRVEEIITRPNVPCPNAMIHRVRSVHTGSDITGRGTQCLYLNYNVFTKTN